MAYSKRDKSDNVKRSSSLKIWTGLLAVVVVSVAGVMVWRKVQYANEMRANETRMLNEAEESLGEIRQRTKENDLKFHLKEVENCVRHAKSIIRISYESPVVGPAEAGRIVQEFKDSLKELDIKNSGLKKLSRKLTSIVEKERFSMSEDFAKTQNHLKALKGVCSSETEYNEKKKEWFSLVVYRADSIGSKLDSAIDEYKRANRLIDDPE